MPQLIITVEDDFPQIHELDADKATVGRHKENSIRLQPTPVSAYHAVITKENGVYILSDRNSNNGTHVNGKKLTDSVQLEDGDRLSFGPVKALFQDPHRDKLLDPRDPREIESLLRQGEIERNNLRLLNNDLGKLRLQVDNTTKNHDDLLNQVKLMEQKIDAAKETLSNNRAESARLADLISEAKVYRKNSSELNDSLKLRKTEHRELEIKLRDGQQRFDDLDLENSIQRKKQLDIDFASLTQQLNTSNQQLEVSTEERDRVTKAANEASAIFDEAKRVEIQVTAIKEDIAEKTEQQQLLDKTIAEQQTQRTDLENQINQHNRDYEQRIAECKQHHEKLKTDCEQKHTTRVAQCQQEYDDLKTDSQQTHDKQMAECLQDYEKLKTDSQQTHDKQMAECQQDYEKLKTDSQQTHDKRMADCQQEYDKLKTDSQETHDKRMAECLQDYEKLKAETKNKHQAQLDKDRADFEKRRDQCQQEWATLETSTKDKQSQFDTLDSEYTEKQKQLLSVKSELATITGQLNTSQAAITKSLTSQTSLEKEIFTLNRMVGEKSGVLKRLNVKINSRGSTEVTCPPIRLVNPRMNCLVHFFHHGASVPDEERFEPIGYPALAACTRGSMHRDVDSIVSEGDPILLILTGDWRADFELIQSIRSVIPDASLIACWGEGQLPTFTKQEGTAELQHLLKPISGVISVDPETARLFDDAKKPPCKHLNLPLPIPVEFPEWDLSISVADRTRGLFISGDGYDSSNPVHKTRMRLINSLIKKSESTITLFQNDPVPLNDLKVPAERIQYYEGPIAYSDYLKIASQHYLFSGFGRNFLGGDITGDAVLSRTLFVGADHEHTFDRLLFPDTCIQQENDYNATLKHAIKLLNQRDAYYENTELTQNLATQTISFDAVRDHLREFIETLSK